MTLTLPPNEIHRPLRSPRRFPSPLAAICGERGRWFLWVPV